MVKTIGEICSHSLWWCSKSGTWQAVKWVFYEPLWPVFDSCTRHSTTSGIIALPSTGCHQDYWICSPYAVINVQGRQNTWISTYLLNNPFPPFISTKNSQMAKQALHSKKRFCKWNQFSTYSNSAFRDHSKWSVLMMPLKLHFWYYRAKGHWSQVISLSCESSNLSKEV